jgi:hypothetical protein
MSINTTVAQAQCATTCTHFNKQNEADGGPYQAGEVLEDVCIDTIEEVYHKDNCCPPGEPLVDKNGAEISSSKKVTRTRTQSGTLTSIANAIFKKLGFNLTGGNTTVTEELIAGKFTIGERSIGVGMHRLVYSRVHKRAVKETRNAASAGQPVRLVSKSSDVEESTLQLWNDVAIPRKYSCLTCSHVETGDSGHGCPEPAAAP